MQKDLNHLSLSEVYDLLAATTVRYNYILLNGGSREEFNLLAECLELIQKEITSRKLKKS